MRLICVAGMHRSGTSLVARVLSLLGADVGPEDAMITPTDANPKGYWEIKAISVLTEELMKHLGGRWFDLPPLSPDWQHDPSLDPFRERARQILDSTVGDSSVAVVKDPRLSILSPFLRTVVPIDTTVVGLRHPDEVVGSLRRRDDFDAERSAALWTDYVTATWSHSPERVLVRYDAMLDDPATHAQRLAAALDLPAPSPQALEAVADFTDPDLRRATGDEHGAGPELGLARSLWELITEHEGSTDAVDTVLERLWQDRNGARVARRDLRDAASDLEEAERRIEDAERHTAEVEAELGGRIEDLELTVRRRTREAQDAVRSADRWQAEFERLRGRRSVRAALATAEALRPALRATRRLRARATTGAREQQSGDEPQEPHEPASVDEERTLAAELRRTAPGSDRGTGPLVSVCVLNRDGADHLGRLLPGLARTTYRSFELVVVDNASSDGSVELLRSTDVGVPLTIIENAENASFAVGNNQAVDAASGVHVLLLNNDVEPVGPGWLGHMVDTLEAHGADAVGARLVYPRRPGLVTNQGDTTHPDLTLQHRGVHFRSDADGIPRAHNLGGGEDPLSAAAAAVGPRPAVTAACMLVRRDRYEAVGGLDAGYVYGTEDVDLCLKLRERGGSVVYDGQAVLWHHEYATQNVNGNEAKRRQRERNRERFVDLWGARLYRQVVLDKLAGDRSWSEEPLRVAITVTKDDPRAGYGDYYTARELGRALGDLGHDVTYVERFRDRWYDLDPATDVLVVLLDAFDLRRVSRSIVSVAWIRNWTERWIDRPWFDDYDVVLASSARSGRLVEERSSQVAHLFPLATNPERFTPEGTVDDDVLAVFTGNHWDQPRAIVPALQSLPEGLDVRVHGANWDQVEGMARFDRGPVDYAALPAVYRGADVVIDDTASHAAPYEAVNSRVFDALAAGTPVVTDNPEGLVEVLGDELRDELLVWRDGPTLRDQLAWVAAHPDEARERASRWREIVLRDHTYAVRATQLTELLAAHVGALRFAIAVGVPREDERHRWGDEHFARGLQRQLARRGHPSRVVILPEWEQAHVARQDVLLHLFGLSQLRTRPGQTSVLWNISHPELVTPALVDRYDVALCAGQRFGEELDRRTATRVHHLPQATDPDRFRPDPTGAPHHQLLFVGNSRRVRRRVVEDVVSVLDRLPGPPALAIYGADWTPSLVDPRHVVADHVDNRDLGSLYAAADVVLNDHWDDMRAEGFLSNRLYDALAAGAFVLSDHVDGIEEQFDDTVVTYADREELRRALAHHLTHPDDRRARARRGREIVLARHTFGHRVERILELVDEHRRTAGDRLLVLAG